MAAGQINTIGPSIAVPEVPTGPRVSVNSDLAQGLLDFARGVDRVAKAQSLYAEEMRQHREAAAADPDTDYARKTTEFRKKAAAAREKLVSDPKTAPQSEAERQAFDRDADAIETGMARDVERSGFEQAVPAIRERLFGDLDKLSRDAVLDVAGTADKHMRMVAVENIRRHVEAGILKAGEAPRVLQAFDAAVQEAGVRKLAGGDPAAAAAALGEDGAYPSIGAARRQQLVEEFDVAARTRQAETDGELDNALKELNSAFHDSRVPGAELVANLRRLAADSGNEKAAIAADAADAGLSFARKLGRMPVEDGVKLWTTLRDGKETGPARDAALAFGAAQLRDMDRQLKSDPLAFATAQGFADVEPLDFMQATPDHLVQRAKTARMVQAFYRLPDTQFLTGDERQSLGAAFKAADPSRKLALVGSITGAFGGPSAGKLLREIDGIVPAESHLATLSLHGGGREATARRGFEGQRAIADKAVTLPAESEFARVEGAQIGAMLDVRLTNTRAAIIGAARALYAERAVSRGLTDFDPFEYTKALQEAAGKGSDGGGIGTRHGRKILLPMDMDQNGLNASLDAITAADLTRMSVGTGRPVHVTLSGKVMPATGAEIREAYPVQSGYGRFRLSMTDPDTEAPQYLVDEATGTFYEMDLSDPKRRPTAEPRVYSGRAKVFEPKARPAAPVQPKDQSRVPAESEAPLSKLIYDRIPAEG